jgi:hypothetical protein
MRTRLGAIVTALFLVGCTGAGGTRMNSDIHRGPMPTGGTWAGIWFSTWGEMSLSLQGSSVVGEFCNEEDNRYGRLEGTAQGNVFTFHWMTTDVTMAGSPRTSEGSGIVQFSFLAAGEAQQGHFEGTWGFEESNADGGPLRGDRSSRYSDRFLRGGYTIACALREVGEAPPPMTDEEIEDNPVDEAGEETGEGGSGQESGEEGSDEEPPGPLDI